jgi:YhgE/Pip-like protein
MGRPEQPTALPRMRASQLLKVGGIWVSPVIVASLLIFLMTLTYFGSLLDPAGHLHGLPVLIINEDNGATVHGQRADLGQQVTAALTQSPAIGSRLALTPATLTQAQAQMNVGTDYADIVIPATFTRSLLALTGSTTPAAGTPPKPTIQLLTNARLGTLGVSLATGVAQPALGHVSRQIGQRLLPASTAANRANPVIRAQLADPVSVVIVPYRPLPPHSGLGLSAFYIALVALLCGFLAAIIVNSSVDGALGYATADLGPWWSQKLPVPISRWHTLLVKWVMAVVIVPLLTAIMLVVAVGLLRMDHPYVGYLWLFTSLAAVTVAIATLVLLAALGSFGQLLAIILIIYLAMASSGGTVPLQAVPGFFRFISQVEPLRQVLDGTRAILYFDAQADAGLTRSLIVLSIELLFWVAVGIAITTWYDRKKLDRMRPELLAFLNRSVLDYARQTAKQQGANQENKSQQNAEQQTQTRKAANPPCRPPATRQPRTP